MRLQKLSVLSLSLKFVTKLWNKIAAAKVVCIRRVPHLLLLWPNFSEWNSQVYYFSHFFNICKSFLGCPNDLWDIFKIFAKVICTGWLRTHLVLFLAQSGAISHKPNRNEKIYISRKARHYLCNGNTSSGWWSRRLTLFR